MSAPRRHLEPVDPDTDWVETFSYEVHEPRRSLYERSPERRVETPTAGPDRLRVMATQLWFAWLIVAGVIVGGTTLTVLARLAFVVLRWTVSA